MTDYKKEIGKYLDGIKGRETHSIDKIIEDIRRSKYVCVFGAGNTSQSLISMLKKMTGIRIDFLCDNDPAKWGKVFHEGLTCISPSELEKYKDDVGVIIATRYCKEVYEQLRKMDFNKLYFIGDYRLLNSEFFKSRENIEIIKNNTVKLVELFGDEKSKEILFKLINNWFDYDIAGEGYEGMFSDDEYYPPGVIQLDDNEAFVDGGAYDGDTLLKFLEKTNNNFDAIYSFELDKENFNALVNTVNKLDARVKSKIELYNLGLLDKEKYIHYETGNTRGQNSRISEGDSAVNTARAVRLSDILKDKKVTFIKMDIEGADLDALHGAEEIIRKQKPKMAICVYHKLEHLWEVPFYLKSLVPEYKLFMRHHSTLEYGTVCYAVNPKNADIVHTFI